MFHGYAKLRKDWDIFKEGDTFTISAWLPKYEDDNGIFAIWTGGQRGCTVSGLTFHWTEEIFRELFDIDRSMYKEEKRK